MNSPTKSRVNLDDLKINADLTSPNTKSIALFVDDDDGGNGRWPDFCYMQTRRGRSCPRTTSNRSETTNFNGTLANSKIPHLRKQQPKEIAFDCPETSSKSASEVPITEINVQSTVQLNCSRKKQQAKKATAKVTTAKKNSVAASAKKKNSVAASAKKRTPTNHLKHSNQYAILLQNDAIEMNEYKNINDENITNDDNDDEIIINDVRTLNAKLTNIETQPDVQMGQMNDRPNDVTHVNETNNSQMGQMKQLSEDNVSNDAREHYYADTQTDTQVGQMNDNDGTHVNETNDSQMMKQLSENDVSNDVIKHAGTDPQNACFTSARQTDKQTYKQTDKQTHKQTVIHTNTQTNRHTIQQKNKQTNRHTQKQDNITVKEALKFLHKRPWTDEQRKIQEEKIRERFI